MTRRPSRYPNPGLEVNGKLVDYKNGGYAPDLVTDYLCDFMERKKAEPFLVYYQMILPHWPFEPTPDSKDYCNCAHTDSKVNTKCTIRSTVCGMFNNSNDVSTGQISYHAWSTNLATGHVGEVKEYASPANAAKAPAINQVLPRILPTGMPMAIAVS